MARLGIKSSIIQTIVLLYIILLHINGLPKAVAADPSSTTKLRERVIELEDARDSLQNKYDRILLEYKTLKGEIRSEIECQKNLDEALEKLADVAKKEDNAATLEKALQRCTLQRENALVDLHVTELSLSESLRKYRDLERNVHKEDCKMIKKDLITYRDQAEQCLIDLESIERTQGELSNKVREQDGMLEKYLTIEDSLRHSQNELEVARGRIHMMEKDVEKLRVLEKDYVQSQNELASSTSALEASRNELNATKTALNSLLESLDSRLQYENLKEEHEKEILPYWLSFVVYRAVQHISNLYQSSVQPMYESLHDMIQEGKIHLAGQINDMHESGRRAANTLLHPVVVKADSMLFSHAWIQNYRTAVLTFLRKQNLILRMHIVSLREYGSYCKSSSIRLLESSISTLSRKVPLLQNTQVDNASIALIIFNILSASVVIPLILFIINTTFKGIVYYLRTGTAQIIVADESETVAMLEESIDYKFSRRDYALQALEQSPSLHQVGLALINLILAEQGSDSAKTMAELEHRSTHTCINVIIKPGPGRKSLHVATQQKVYMYVCVLAAVFRDSEESVEQVFKVWNATSASRVVEPAHGMSCEGSSPESDVHDEVVEKPSCSTPSSLSSPTTHNSDEEKDDDEKSPPS